MKRAERKALDKFIEEKLDILHRPSNDLDYTPPDRTEVNKQIEEQFRIYFEEEQLKKKHKKKK